MRKETIYSVTIDKDSQITFKVERYSDKKQSDNSELVFALIMLVLVFGFILLLFLH